MTQPLSHRYLKAIMQDAHVGGLPGDVLIPGGAFILGASGQTPFVFDNEKWAHKVSVEPFHIARAPMTNKEDLTWATRSRMLTGRYRNFYSPDRRDVLAGFRTCAI